PHSRDPASLRPQPRRGGPDYWPTPACLTSALIEHVLPGLRQAPVWGGAAGDGGLALAMRGSGYSVVAGGIEPRGGGNAPLDFLREEPPQPGLLAVTNPPFNALDAFLTRGLQLVDSTRIAGLVLLARSDALFAASRAGAFNRASSIAMCCWRPIW